MLSQRREVIGDENCVDLNQEGYRSLGKMLQGSVRYTFWARSLADLETADGFVNLDRFINVGSLAGISNKTEGLAPSRNSLHSINKDFGHLSLRAIPRGDQGRRGSRNYHHPLAHPP